MVRITNHRKNSVSHASAARHAGEYRTALARNASCGKKNNKKTAGPQAEEVTLALSTYVG